MNYKPATVHPSLIKSHAKVKAWNEYVIEHLGLRLEKERSISYRRLSLYQGTFCLYNDWTLKIDETTNANLHKSLQDYLIKYIENFFKLEGTALNMQFKPPA